MAFTLNLRNRIVLGYLAPMALLVGASASVYWHVQVLGQISRSTDAAHAIVGDIREGHLRLSEAFRAVQEYLLFRNEISHNNYQTAAAQLLDKMQALGRKVEDPVQKASLARISDASRRLLDFMRRQSDLVTAGQSAKAVELFRTGESLDLMREVNSLIVAFDKREAEILSARSRAEDDAVQRLVVVVVGATALAVLLGSVLGVWIASRISRTIGEATANMSTSTAEIAATVEEHERTVTHQAAAVSEVTSTVEELGVSARQTAGQAESVVEAAREATAVTENGTRLSGQVADGLAGLKDKVGSVAGQILRLSEQAAQIGGIARVVGELASETNMLALNAAVEAARAGEHGKGFAIVAAEVRKLAEQSRKSAERANALVGEIQKATNAAVMVTEDGTRTAEEVSALSRRAAEAFDSIGEVAEGVAVNAQQVLLNARQQSTALGQVTEAMKGLSAGSAQMTAGTAQTRAGVQRLNDVARGLEALT